MCVGDATDSTKHNIGCYLFAITKRHLIAIGQPGDRGNRCFHAHTDALLLEAVMQVLCGFLVKPVQDMWTTMHDRYV